MRRSATLVATLLLACSCRNYDLPGHLSRQAGLIPPDVYATYGREQAIAVAIGRELGRPYNSGPGAQARIAVNYAKKFPEVVDVQADSAGYRLTVQFKSGWRAGIVPIDDGKRGDQTRIPS